MNLSRVDELLLDCLHTRSRQAADSSKHISKSDWSDLVQVSSMHGIAPFVFKRLRQRGYDPFIPPETMQSLRNAYLGNVSRNMERYRRLALILERFSRADVSIAVLKGAHLAETVYGDIALRPMNDVDLLVLRKDHGKSETILFEMGYTPTNPCRDISGDDYHFAYRSPDKEMVVELHWNIMPPLERFNIDAGDLWTRARRIIIAGERSHALSPEDLLLHISMHACKEGFFRGLRSLLDICMIIQHEGPGVDWGIIESTTRRWRAEKCVHLVLSLTHELLGGAVPGSLLKAITPDDFDESFVALAKEQIFSFQHQHSTALLSYPNISRLFGSRSFQEKAALFLRRLFPSRVEMAHMYPSPANSWRILLYYPMRIMDLLQRHGRLSWQLLGVKGGCKKLADQGNNRLYLKQWLLDQ